MQLNMNCSRLEEIAHSVSLVRACDVVRSGDLRLSTPFIYPNGEYVDVFLCSNNELFDPFFLSDYGQTALYLKNAQVGIETSARKREIVGDILSQLGVKKNGSNIFIELDSDKPRDISDAIMRLSQACVRISDFASHQRLRSSNPFRDDVEDFFEAHQFEYVPDIKVVGRYDKDVRIDFEVLSGSRKSYVLVLAAMNESSAHHSANEIFRKWYDLKEAGIGDRRFVTIYNSASNAVKSEDVMRLGSYSETVSYPDEQDVLVSLLQGGQSKRAEITI